MGQTNPRYPVMEIALAVEDCASHTGRLRERKRAGDIVAVRQPHYAIGAKERAAYVWLRLEGLEENEMARLADVLVETEDGPVFDKRRYCVPLDRLAEVLPGFDVGRARDTADTYQPFYNLDEETGTWLALQVPPLDVHGLVFDKLTGEYL